MRALSTLIALSVALCLAQPSRAQGLQKAPSADSTSRIAAMGLAPDAAEPVGQDGMYSPQTLEDLRAELLNLADTVQDLTALGSPELIDTSGLEQARVQIQQMSPEYLNTLRKGIDPFRLRVQLLRARTVVADYSRTRLETKRVANAKEPDSEGLPDASGLCGGYTARIPTAVILAADIVWFIADGVREFAQDACKETVVVLGEGGNTSLACVIVDGVWIVAKAVKEGLHFCDDDLTGAVVDGNYARLGHVHGDIVGVQTSVDGVGSQVTNLDTHLTNVDKHITSQFLALDSHLTALIGALSNQVSNVQAALDLANQRLLVLMAGEKQIMKLELTPEGRRQILPSILTCTGSDCLDVLLNCPGGSCSWNNVGPLP